ncbi:protein LHY [Canna indica]|uniref:Protein LHY n=1 Tax=Canna indica TaxID=4628 RepID=A0AAQ3QRT6_9LILI|nr:protein LHY [Canna indica]
MEGNSSGEELTALKTRKPYTITKQRERWTEEEHNLFVEALKLYGRAWQRIEEHIGTKTATQIRSHAQKFFTKLEKEALEKGIPPGQTHDIDIPPPRPKRKPISSYPQKSSTGILASPHEINGKPSKSMSNLSTKKVMDARSNSPGEKFMATQNVSSKEISEDASCLEVVNVFQDALSASISSVNKSSSNHSTKEKIVEKIETDKSLAPHELVQGLDKNGKSFIEQETEGSKVIFTKPIMDLTLESGGKTSKLQGLKFLTSMDNAKGNQTHPMDIVSRNDEKGIQTGESDGHNPSPVTSQVGEHPNGDPSMNPLISDVPVHNVFPLGPMHHLLPSFIPSTYFHCNQDAYRSFLNISSTFSSLFVSTFLQNPAVHAAASLAGSFLPSTGVETSLHSAPEIQAGQISERHMNSIPSLEAIAAATVAAASEWWSAQGLFPWFIPLAGFPFVPPDTSAVPYAGIAQVPVHGSTVENQPREIQQVDENQSEFLEAQHHSSKLLTLSSSYSDHSGRTDHSNDPTGTRSSKIKPLAASGFHLDTNMSKKKRDGSSCGSNTTFSSEMGTDTIEKKHEKVNAEGKEAYFSSLPVCETNHHRLKSSGNMNESWKEVSEKGRVAFQALFKREVLPQSFCPPLTEGAATTAKEGEFSHSPVDLNKKVSSSTNLNRLHHDAKVNTCISSNGRIEYANFKVHQTGFKPYKKCSAEADNSAAAEEQTGNKRIRLQGEAST